MVAQRTGALLTLPNQSTQVTKVKKIYWLTHATDSSLKRMTDMKEFTAHSREDTDHAKHAAFSTDQKSSHCC